MDASSEMTPPFPPYPFCRADEAAPLTYSTIRAIVAPVPQEKTMPEIYVYAIEGRTLEQKRGLVKDITDAVVKNFKAPAEAVVVQIMESPSTSKAKGGILFSEQAR
jgi:4-oxalocrotonate tautomerase